MTPDEVTAATATLQQAVKDAAVQGGQEINADAAALAPGLATGTNAPGGYTYARTVAPVVDPLAAQMVVASKQEVLKQAIKDAQHVAQTKYDDANFGYRQRQRDYTKKQALEAKERQRLADERQAKYDRQQDEMYAAQKKALAGGGGGGGSAGVGTVVASGNGSRPAMVPKNGKNGAAGYNFTDANGKPISASTFATLAGVKFTDLLSQMANTGDAGAARVMKNSDNSKDYANAYRALTWK